MSIPAHDCAFARSLLRIPQAGVIFLLPFLLTSVGCGKVRNAANRPAVALEAQAFSKAVDEKSGETYKKIEEHPFVPASVLPFSTFSVDVDTASYSNVRRFLKDGTLPPKDAVRIEELVNYFHYDYPSPIGPHPVGVNAEVAICPWNEKNLLARIAVQARRIDERERKPMNLVFLVDTSGSMGSENRLPLLKQGLSLLVEKLRSVDRVAIVTYAGSSGIALPSTAGSEKERIRSVLNSLGSGGSTHGSAGIETAYNLAEKNFIKDGVNRVILGTDGDFNVGITSQDALVKLIETKRKTGIYLTVLGFGMGNLKDETMESLAEHGNGHYAYIDTLEEARRVMVDNLTHMEPVARDVKIQVEFNPAKVLYYRLIGYDNRLLAKEDFENDAKDAGDMGAGQQVTAIYEIIPQSDDAKIEVKDAEAWGEAMMKANLRYIPPAGKTSSLIEHRVIRIDTPITKASDDFRFVTAVAAYGMVLRDSPERGTASFDLAEQLARTSLGRDADGSRTEFLTLIPLARKAR